MPLHILDNLFRSQHGIATRHQALDAGATVHELNYWVRTRKLAVVHRNVYRASGSPLTRTARIQAAVLAAGPNAVASHTSSLHLHGLPTFERNEQHVSIERGENKRPGITIHRALIPASHLVILDRIPTTSVARACVDTASILRPHELRRLMNEAVISRKVTYKQIDTALGELGSQGRKGTATLRVFLDENLELPASTSALAPTFLRAVQALRIEQPTMEHHIVVNGNNYWLDAAWVDRKLAVELDDYGSHGTSKKRFDHDRRRNNDLLVDRWQVIHLTSAMSRNEIAAILKPFF